MTDAQLNSAIEELNRTFQLPVYEGFDVAWIVVIKIANTLPGSSEHARLLELLNRLPEDSVRHILAQRELDTLLDLQPPLEAILNSRHERLNAKRTADELRIVRQHREDNPKEALHKLADILKRIRNRRAHGFKTPEGPRDREILGSSLVLLRLVGLMGAESLGAK